MKLELRFGLLLAAIGFLWVCGEFFLGYHTTKIAQHAQVTMFIFPFVLGCYYLGIRARRESAPDRSLTWLQGFKAGLLITAVSLPLSLAGQVVFHLAVNPGFFDAMVAHVVATGRASETTARAYFNLGNYLVQTLLAGAVFGLRASAVSPLFLRRRPGVAAAAVR